LGQSKDNEFDSNIYYGLVAAPGDPHALTVDPQFVAPGTGGVGHLTLSGYRLKPGSPARGTGKLLEKNGGQDYWGNKVPSCGKTDRGASQADDCDEAHK
jgi:hypothetical protein